MSSLDWLFWAIGGLLAAGGLALLAWSLLWDRARGRRRCPKCWYDMSGAGPQASDLRTHDPLFRCPECGRQSRRERSLARTRRRWRWAVLAAALLLLAWGVVVGQRVAGGWKDRKLNALPHPLVKLALWACCAWDGPDQPRTPNFIGSPVTSLRSALNQSRGQTIAEQWNDLLTAYKLGRSLESAPADREWDPAPDGTQESLTDRPSFDDCCTELSVLDAEGWPAVGPLVHALEGRLPPGGTESQRATAAAKALWVLQWIGPEASEAIPALQRLALKTTSGNARQVIATIVAVSPHPERSLAALLGADSDWVAICTLEELRNMGPNAAGAVGAVGRLARAGRTSTLRIYALSTLKAIAPPRTPGAVEALALCLRDPDPNVVIPAARTLGYWSPEAKSAVPDLCALARSTTDDSVRLTAAWSVSCLAPGSPEAVDLAARVAEGEDVPAAIWALRALESWGPDAAAAADRLRPLLETDSRYVRARAAAALAAMNGEQARFEPPAPAEFDWLGAEGRR